MSAVPGVPGTRHRRPYRGGRDGKSRLAHENVLTCKALSENWTNSVSAMAAELSRATKTARARRATASNNSGAVSRHGFNRIPTAPPRLANCTVCAVRAPSSRSRA
jgi:hypothetical protein